MMTLGKVIISQDELIEENVGRTLLDQIKHISSPAFQKHKGQLLVSDKSRGKNTIWTASPGSHITGGGSLISNSRLCYWKWEVSVMKESLLLSHSSHGFHYDPNIIHEQSFQNHSDSRFIQFNKMSDHWEVGNGQSYYVFDSLDPAIVFKF